VAADAAGTATEARKLSELFKACYAMQLAVLENAASLKMKINYKTCHKMDH